MSTVSLTVTKACTFVTLRSLWKNSIEKLLKTSNVFILLMEIIFPCCYKFVQLNQSYGIFLSY